MFSGIVEAIGEVKEVIHEGSNVHLEISAPFAQELKIDQSVAHNGVCLTVVGLDSDNYRVTAIEETIRRSNLGNLKAGSVVNLERCLRMNDRLDGHMVQGHVDMVAQCVSIEDHNGSWKFVFEYGNETEHVTVEKGSICVNGVSLTVVESWEHRFSVHVIPYTYEHTNFKDISIGDLVNLEFDIIGKYVSRYLAIRNK